MNQSQIKYAKTKIENLYWEKQSKIEEKYKVPSLSSAEIHERLIEGRFSIKEFQPKRYYGGYLSEYIVIEGQEQSEELKKQRTDALEALKESKSRMMDELILGDAQEALEILRRFENQEF